MAVTREQVIEYLSALTPDRLQDLILELEDIWGIERPATNPGWVTMGVPWPWDPEEQTEWSVVLLDPGPDRVAVIRAVRDRSKLSLSEARTLVDTRPAVIAECLARSEADELCDRLAALGATVERR